MNIELTLLTSTYSIGGFVVKTNTAVLRQKQDWKAAQFKNVNLIIPGNYTVITYNNCHIRLVDT